MWDDSKMPASEFEMYFHIEIVNHSVLDENLRELIRISIGISTMK